jgi:hypothetical protein
MASCAIVGWREHKALMPQLTHDHDLGHAKALICRLWTIIGHSHDGYRAVGNAPLGGLHRCLDRLGS